jgi:hypothetical protein
LFVVCLLLAMLESTNNSFTDSGSDVGPQAQTTKNSFTDSGSDVAGTQAPVTKNSFTDSDSDVASTQTRTTKNSFTDSDSGACTQAQNSCAHSSENKSATEDDSSEDNSDMRSSKKKKRRKLNSQIRALRPKLSPRSRKRKNRVRKKIYDYEFKAKVVSWFDKVTDEVKLKQGGKGKKRVRDRDVRIDQTNEKFGLTDTPTTIKKWISKEGRQRIELVLGCSIAEYFQLPTNKGGRGRKTVGRYIRKLCERRAAKYELAEGKCIIWLRQQRKKGLRVSSKTLRKYMIKQVHKLHQDSPNYLHFKASQGWLKRFMARHHLCWRMRNDNALKSAEQLAHGVQKFIKELRRLRAEHPDQNDQVWGKFGPRYTFNVDQVPLPFASTQKRTIEFMGTQRVWIKQPGSGLDKRQATLQLLIRGEGKQPKPVLIFRGKKHYTRPCDKDKRAKESELYDKDVEVLWQPKSWADTETCVEWAEGSLADFVNEHIDGPILLMTDRLTAQIATKFTDAIQQVGQSPSDNHIRYGPAGATHIWQPVDRHIGARYKNLMSDLYHDYMADRGDRDDDSKVTTGQRRVLLTQWAGQAYRALEEEREQAEQKCASMDEPDTAERSLFYRSFLRTGCLVDIHGKYDEHIHVHKDLPKGTEFLNTVYEAAVPVVQQEAQVNLDDSTSNQSGDEGDQGEDTEDEDDELPEDSDDEELEFIPDSMEIDEVSDEQALIRSAESEIPAQDTQQLLDFRFSRRVAGQNGTSAYMESFSNTTSAPAEGDNRRSSRPRKQRYASLAFN